MVHNICNCYEWAAGGGFDCNQSKRPSLCRMWLRKSEKAFNEYKKIQNEQLDRIASKEPKQMTRNEAEKLVAKLAHSIEYDNLFDGRSSPSEKQFVNVLEALGLIKFEGEKKVICLSEINSAGATSNNFHATGANILRNYGPIRLELWSEGLVLWVGGEIRWKSWER